MRMRHDGYRDRGIQAEKMRNGGQEMAMNETAGPQSGRTEEPAAMPEEPKDEANALTTTEIMDILPHREPFLLVDRILDYEPGHWAMGRKCVTMDEPFFKGHFPGHPVMPGVLILEALAQTGAVAVLSLPENRGKIALFGGVNKARFQRQVVPGDVLDMRCELIRQSGPVGIARAEARVDGKLACRAEIMFAVQ